MIKITFDKKLNKIVKVDREYSNTVTHLTRNRVTVKVIPNRVSIVKDRIFNQAEVISGKITLLQPVVDEMGTAKNKIMSQYAVSRELEAILLRLEALEELLDVGESEPSNG